MSEINSPACTREIAADPSRGGQHLGALAGLLVLALALVAACERRTDPAPAASSSARSEPDPMAELPDGSVPEPPARVIGSTPPRPAATSAPVREKRAAEPKTALGIFDAYGFPVVSGVEHLCGRRDFPLAGGALTWDAFASDTPPAQLVARYEKRLGSQGMAKKGQGAVWKLPVDAAMARSLEILSLNAPGPHRACKAKPAPAAKSIILVSRR